jgi:Lon-like ATP-dependent protease
VIAINRHPVFPKFIKIVEVTDEGLMAVLRRKVKLNQPYAGVFVKRDDENNAEVVKNTEDLYPVGSFVQVIL